MTTVQEMLKKSMERKKTFRPQQRRAWDYLTTNEDDKVDQKNNSNNYNNKNEINTNNNEVKIDNKAKQNKNENKIKNGNNVKQNTNICTNNFSNDLIRIEQDNICKADETNTEIKENLNEENILKVLRKTTGLQQKIMLHLVSHLKSQNEFKNKIEIPISILSSRINADKYTTRTSIKRLQKKKILLKEEGDRGRHGSTNVLIPEFVVKEYLKLFDIIPNELKDTRISFDCYGEQENGLISTIKNRNNSTVYSSNSNINITTTTKKEKLPKNWEEIDTEPLIDIGFSKTQIKQLYDKNCTTPEIVQDSIYRLSYTLKYNSKKVEKYSDVLNVFMGILRRGGGWTEPDYKSVKEIAMENLIKEKIRENEKISKLKKDFFDLEFEQWCSSLSENNKKSIIEQYDKKNKPTFRINTPDKIKLITFFKEKVWPDREKEYNI